MDNISLIIELADLLKKHNAEIGIVNNSIVVNGIKLGKKINFETLINIIKNGSK